MKQEVSIAKTKITETIEKYDKDGSLIEKITREKALEGDTDCPSRNDALPEEQRMALILLNGIRHMNYMLRFFM